MSEKYFLLLKTGQSEMRAFNNLPATRRALVVPIYELTRGKKNHKNKISSGSEVYDFESTVSFVRETAPQGGLSFIDITRSSDLTSDRLDSLSISSDGYRNWVSFVEGLTSVNAWISPVLQVNTSEGETWEEYREKLCRQFDSLAGFSKAIAYRACKNVDDAFDLDMQLLAERIASYVARGGEFYFLLDYEYIRVSTGSLHGPEASSILDVITDIVPQAKIVLLSTSFPSSVTDVGGETYGVVPIEEIEFHKLVAQRLSNKAVVIYGDYGSINPTRNDHITRGWRPRIDYPYGGRSIFYHREKRPTKKDVSGKTIFLTEYSVHYISLGKKIVRDEFFLLDPHSRDKESWGVSQIRGAANNQLGGSSASFWISVRMNIHIEQQLHRLGLLPR